jgi:hypothetical protein
VIGINYEKVSELMSNDELRETLRKTYRETMGMAKPMGLAGQMANDIMAFAVIASFIVEEKDIRKLRDKAETDAFLEQHGNYILELAKKIFPEYLAFTKKI